MNPLRARLEEQVAALCKEILHRALDPGEPNPRLFTFAESCTGGLVAAAVTSVSGISAVFPGSVVTYGNEAKMEHLRVRPETLADYGAVSPECAVEMAEGARRLFGTDYAVAVTGIAGPMGGTPEKPVGTVWFALSAEGGAVKVRKGFYTGHPRRTVQFYAARAALRMLVEAL